MYTISSGNHPDYVRPNRRDAASAGRGPVETLFSRGKVVTRFAASALVSTGIGLVEKLMVGFVLRGVEFSMPAGRTNMRLSSACRTVLRMGPPNSGCIVPRALLSSLGYKAAGRAVDLVVSIGNYALGTLLSRRTRGRYGSITGRRDYRRW